METPVRAPVVGSKINVASASAGFHQALAHRIGSEEHHHSVVAYLSPRVRDVSQSVRLYAHLQLLRQEVSVLSREPRELGEISQPTSAPSSQEQSVGFASAQDLPVLLGSDRPP